MHLRSCFCLTLTLVLSFNQTLVAYDASKQDKVEALKTKKSQVEERLRE